MQDDKLLKAGDRFGGYVVVKLLGRGGMGAVYLAKNVASGELCAIKIMIPPEGDSRHEWRKRFAREAEFAMRIRHKNLVAVYDVGEDPDTGFCYIIMDYVPGGSLTDRIKAQGKLTIREAVDITIQVAAALEVAHKAGVVHRDIKPDNIMFDADDTPKLTDLGVAKFSGAEAETTVTKTGMVVGTPAYMSPEQMMNSHTVDARSDIYSLGVVFYEMLTGIRPNADSTIVQLLAKAITGEELPDIRTVRPEVSAAIAYVLARMVAVKVDVRPASAYEVATLLYDAATGKLVVKKSAREIEADRLRRRKALVALAKGCALVVGGLAFAALVALAIRGLRHGGYPPGGGTPSVVANIVERVITNKVVHVQSEANPVPDANGVYTSRLGSYDWRYVLDANGDATLIGNGDTPCISPKPDGKVEVPAELAGHKVATIGNRAFINCDKMTAITLPDGLVRFSGWGAFKGCSGLKSIDLPPSVKSLGNETFKGCTSLQSVNMANCESSDIWIGNLFVHTPQLSRIETAPTNPRFVTRDGAMYSRNGKDLLAYPKTLPDIKMPQDISVIGMSAFRSCCFKTVKLPEGIGAVRHHAFEDCLDITKVEFPRTLKSIGRNLFARAPKLETVVFQGDAPSCEGQPFGVSEVDFIVEVPRGSKGWNGPGSTDLPDRWPVGAGGDSRRIRYIGEVDAQAAAPAKPKGPAKTTLLVPRLDRDPKAWAYSFEEQDGWEKLDFNDSRWKRAQGGFGHYVPHWNRWGQINTEWPTKKLFLRKRFNWPGGNITRVAAHAFHDDGMKMYLNGMLICADPYCKFDWLPFDIPVRHFEKALKQGENVLAVEVTNDELGGYFDCDLAVECDGEKEQYIPGGGIRQIQTQDGVWTVKIVNGVAQIGDGENAALTPRPVGELAIPSELGGMRIRGIARRAFFECNGLTRVEIPQGVRSVGNDAFLRCKDLKQVDIPESLEYIGLAAFQDTSLESIDIKNVRSIQGCTFRWCRNLKEVRAHKDNPFYFSNDGVLYDKCAKAVVFCPRNRKHYKFPKGIRAIYECAFNQTELEAVVIPDTVEYVGDRAFADCPKLEKVEFKGNDCRLDSWAFGHNLKLKSVVLPRKLTSLDDWSIFEGDPLLEAVNIPDTVEILSDAVFANCKSLKRLSFGKSLRTVRRVCFERCTSLESVSFARVPKFEGDYILGRCPNLKAVRFLSGDAPEVDPTFYKDSNPSLVTLVPRGSKGWNGPGSTDLPERWPLNAGENARRIQYAGK